MSVIIDGESQLEIFMYNNAGYIIPAQTCVYSTGNNTDLNLLYCDIADINTPSKLPCLGITRQAIPVNSIGSVIIKGLLSNITGHDFSGNLDQIVYVGSNGSFSLTVSSQSIGKVVKRTLVTQSVSNTSYDVLVQGRYTEGSGSSGSSAFVYIAYASDSSGTGFTTTFNSSLDYIAIKSTTVAIASPSVSDFIDLWKNYKGQAGTNGTNGQGVPASGSTGQILSKIDNTNYNTQWINPPSAGSGSLVSLTDVNIPSPLNGQILTYSSGSLKWVATTIYAGGYDDHEAQTYFAALSTPLSLEQQTRVSNFVTKLKNILLTNDLSTRFDFFYLLGNETEESSRFNLIKRAHDITNVNSVLWTQWQGFTGDGSSSYLDTNYNPATQKVSFSLNQCAIGIYIRTQAVVCSRAIA